MEKIERTLLLIKPDGVERGLIGEIIRRIEQKGLKITALKMVSVDEQTARRLYAEHVHKEFFGSLVDYIMSGPIAATVLEGKNVVSVVRTMVGATDPSKASKGTIRGDFASCITQNTVHASDSLESAKREISIFFDDTEFIE
ncbi:MAG: nucleoside-diphosphate kinase [Methanocellales archaeon]|nr:nucleoside-diphosphate kinase [Methanocellales archaeon]MDD5446483.1 nucleoside-diphosphate kinase [Methanocellales archaeon]